MKPVEKMIDALAKAGEDVYQEGQDQTFGLPTAMAHFRRRVRTAVGQFLIDMAHEVEG